MANVFVIILSLKFDVTVMRDTIITQMFNRARKGSEVFDYCSFE